MGSPPGNKDLFNIWAPGQPWHDSGEIFYQRISFETLKDLIGDNAVGKAQLENILARCTYKGFGTKNKLD